MLTAIFGDTWKAVAMRAILNKDVGKALSVTHVSSFIGWFLLPGYPVVTEYTTIFEYSHLPDGSSLDFNPSSVSENDPCLVAEFTIFRRPYRAVGRPMLPPIVSSFWLVFNNTCTLCLSKSPFPHRFLLQPILFDHFLYTFCMSYTHLASCSS